MKIDQNGSRKSLRNQYIFSIYIEESKKIQLTSAFYEKRCKKFKAIRCNIKIIKGREEFLGKISVRIKFPT